MTFSCLYVDGEALVTELDRRGFGVASGSACTAVDADAQPRAGGDGRADPRQRAASRSAATPTAAEVDAVPAPRCPASVDAAAARERERP